MPRPQDDSLRKQVANAEARLAELDTERAATERRLEELRRQLVAAEMPNAGLPVLEPGRRAQSKHDKLALFRSLFVGRTDVFPRMWQNSRTRAQGYAPACGNEWVRGICEKPRIKCGECPNQAFLEITDEVLLDHLQGRHAVGVYALSADETCRFLAVDFDKGHWQEDVAAYVATSRRLGLPPAVERSRSGKGAHVWFFFSTPVPATDARKMASYLLTETMMSRPGLPMSSYDRLFPNQDTMPRGGFGNLIALPLQYEARQLGNTVFVNDAWQPFSDQWAYLATLPRIAPARVTELAREASIGGKVVGLRAVDTMDGEAGPLWLRLPSGDRATDPVVGPLPAKARAVLDQQLFVEKAGLPSALLNQISRLAAFENPQFFEKQALRLSTARTPRVISCAEDLPEHIALPRGCVSALEELLRGHGINLVVDDRRTEGESLGLKFHGALTDLQEGAVRALLAHEASVPDSEERVLLATGRFVGEGFDDARLDTLFLALPVSWKGTLVQYAGRLHRMHQGKTDVCIFDYVDREIPVLARMFAKRLKGYRAMGYEIATRSEIRKRGREYVIEYDEEEMRLAGRDPF